MEVLTLVLYVFMVVANPASVEFIEAIYAVCFVSVLEIIAL
jgi:hypothetical protein